MSEQVTLSLPENVMHQAQVWARQTGRSLNDVLSEAVERSLRPLGAPVNERPPCDWSDEEVQAAADLRMTFEDDRRQSELLHRQQAGRITPNEHTELAALMQVYSQRLLTKALGLQEAVRRGLREPLKS